MINKFSSIQCELGEGILWHPEYQSLFWVDISTKTIYQKYIDSGKHSFDKCWVLQETPTALSLLDKNDCILILTEKRIIRLNLNDEVFSSIVEFELPDTHRTNDGGVGPYNSYWFGSMEKEPTGLNGAIYWVSESGEVNTLDFPIGIPNTFVWNNEQQRMFISDSFQQIMYSFKETEEGWIPEKYIDLSNTGATPDGGCLDGDNHIWNAQWDGSCVVNYNGDGALLDKIKLPIPRPTNCCIGGIDYNKLFITSASVGLSSKELSDFPLSGCVLEIELIRSIGVPEVLKWSPKC